MDSFLQVLPYFFQYGYVALAAFMFFGGLYLPVPSNIGLVAAGVLASISYDDLHFNIFLAAAISFVAAILGDVGSYYIARRFGHHERRERFEAKHKSFQKVSGYLKRHPVRTVSVTRLIGFLSPTVNSLSGFTKMPIRTFLMGDILGNFIYVIVFMGAGYLIGGALNSLVAFIAFVTGGFAIIAAIYVGAIVFMRKR